MERESGVLCDMRMPTSCGRNWPTARPKLCIQYYLYWWGKLSLHTLNARYGSSVWYTLVNCSIHVPRFSLAFQCGVVRITQASVYHQSERGKKEPAEYGHEITCIYMLWCQWVYVKKIICTKYRVVQKCLLWSCRYHDTGLQKNHAQENKNITLTDSP